MQGVLTPTIELWSFGSLTGLLSPHFESVSVILSLFQKQGCNTWPFIMVGEIVFEKKDDPPRVQGYHVRGFSYSRQPLDIVCNFILYFLWSERCWKHFDNLYSSRKIFQQVWVATVEVGMATWKAINSLRYTRDPSIQARIDQTFRAKWSLRHLWGWLHHHCVALLAPLVLLGFLQCLMGLLLPSPS